MKGDKIVGINGKPVRYFDELGTELSQYKNQNAILDIERNNVPEKIDIKVDDKGKLGFYPNTKIAEQELSLIHI